MSINARSPLIDVLHYEKVRFLYIEDFFLLDLPLSAVSGVRQIVSLGSFSAAVFKRQ